MSQRQKRSILQRSTMGIVLLLFHCCAISASAVDVTYTVSSNTDDADEISDGTVYVTDGSSFFSSTRVGFRFQNVNIPAGATITSATLEVFSNSNGTTSFSVDILAQDADNPSTFTTSNGNITSRPITSAQTLWSTGSVSYSVGDSIVSPNFASSIQEVIDRSGWASGNSLVVLTTANSGDKGIYKRSGSPTHAPQLHISYTTVSSPLRLHLKLDETSGTAANDSSEYNNHGTLVSSPTWRTDGQKGGALDFETDDGADRVDVPSFDTDSSTITLAAWVKVETLLNDSRLIMKSTGTASSNQTWGMTINNTGAFDFRVSAGGTWDRVQVPGVIVVGQWYHVAGTYDGTTMRAYIDGVEVGSKAHSVGGKIDADLGAPITLGDSTAGGRPLDGLLDDVRVYDYALPSSEVLRLASSGLIGHWKLDETSGTTAVDSSDSGYDGTYTNGATPGSAGVRGYAADFDGSNDYITVSGGSDYNLQQNVTVSCWAKSDTATWSGWGCLVSKRNQFYLHPSAGGTYIYFAGDTTGSGDHSAGVDMATIGSIQNWHHYVGVYDYDAGEVRFYVDGVLRATTTLTANTSLESDTGALTIGWDDGLGGTRYFDGKIDDVRLYNCTLTNAEVAELYGLIGHWKLDETSGTTASDSSELKHDGTLIGSPAWNSGGVYSGGLEYDYTDGNDYVEIPNSDALDILQLGDYSMSTWFKPSSVPPETGSGNLSGYGLIKKRNSSLGLHYSHITGFQFNHYADEGSGGVQQAVTSTGNYPGKWHHVVATVNVSAGLVSMYVNGELVGTNSFVPGSPGIDYGSQQWRLGISNPGGSSSERPAHGVQDDVRLYNRVLTSAEIAELHGLVGHWKLDENAGSTATDSSLAENDGTYQGGAAPGASGPYAKAGANAAEFEGNSGDKIALPTMDFDFSNGLTLSVWYNVDNLTGSYTDFFSLSNGSLVDDIWFGLDNAQGLDLFLADTADGASFRGLIESTSIALNSWQHAVAVIDSSGNAVLYRNGVVVASGYVGLPRDTARTVNGIGETTFGHTIDGRLFDTRIYNRPLSASEVAELHGLVGHWKFDEGSGITAADSTAFGNNATLYGATWTNSCEGGNAIEFDGVGGIASTDADFCPPATGSVAMWLRSAGNPGSRSRPFGNGGNWEVRQEPDGTLSFDLGGEGPDVGAGGDEFVTTEGLSFEDRWYHVVAQFDADDESFEIYIDGSLVHSGTNGDDMTEQAANILSFGTRTGSTEYWEGGMRDFRVYNRWLAAGNIAEIYGSLGHWKLDETSGTVATDSSGAGNDGAYVASPTLGVTSRYPVKLGTAVEFDGTNRMEVPGRLSEPANVTIAAWAKLDAADAGGQKSSVSVTASRFAWTTSITWCPSSTTARTTTHASRKAKAIKVPAGTISPLFSTTPMICTNCMLMASLSTPFPRLIPSHGPTPRIRRSVPTLGRMETSTLAARLMMSASLVGLYAPQTSITSIETSSPRVCE
ncbi:MAG: LamG domain-containing protein [Lacipirellulaceae bacterium]